MYKKTEDRRYTVFLYVMMVLLALLVIRLIDLQIVSGSYYRELADGNRIRRQTIPATRGVMMARDGEIWVGSRPVYIVAYAPQNGPLSEELANRLSAVLGVAPERLREQYDKHRNYFGSIPLAVDIGQDKIARIEERRAEFPGVTIEVQPIRYYPYGSLAANVIGYVGEAGPDDRDENGEEYRPGSIVGRSGLETYYNHLLRGTDGGKQVEVDATGQPVKNIEAVPIVPGHNLRLTLDLRLQQATEAAIREQISLLATEQIWPTGVAAVAPDPNTGAVLAMANWPSFDPNAFAGGISTQEWRALNDNPMRPLDNKAISGLYPPGSLFKVVTGVAALEAQVVTPEEQIYDEGKHWLIDKHNAGGEAFGWINFYEAMAKSDNVYFYELGNRLGIEPIARTAHHMGLGELTGIDLYGEAKGLVASEAYKREVFDEDWYLGETFDAAIGQSFHLTTPLQLGVLFSEIANGGTRYRPYLVSRIDRPDGSPYRIHTPEVIGKTTISKAVLDVVRQSLWRVSQTGGTAGDVFRGYPIAIAAKTATAETASGRDHGMFAAYAPFDRPQIVVVVVVEHGGYGVMSAAPIAKRMLDSYFRLDTAQTQGGTQ